ncbi:hypothetical protein HanIR_Chr02g0092371 [Helianthus annuus]|nr:hypothetical protein HanIR_Chr02g0092371 [Helianthus annuus]
MIDQDPQTFTIITKVAPNVTLKPLSPTRLVWENNKILVTVLSLYLVYLFVLD